MEEDKLKDSLRELVASIYNDCIGAYGTSDSNPYCGQYEELIQAVVDELRGVEN